MPGLCAALVLLIAGCAADGPDAQRSASSSPLSEEVSPSDGFPAPSVDDSDVSAEPTDDSAGLAEAGSRLQIVSAKTEPRRLPTGATELAFRAFVGASAQDPRFVELSLLRFDDPAAVAALLDELRAREYAVEVDADDTAVAFVVAGSGPNETPRQRQALPGLGPTPEALFARGLGDGKVVYGAARSVHQRDIVELLGALTADGTLDATPLPGMRSSVDTPLVSGTAIEFRSLDGPVNVTVYDRSAAWFEFATHGNTAPTPDELSVAGFAQVSYEPSASFAFSGDPIDPQTITVASAEHLIHPT